MKWLKNKPEHTTGLTWGVPWKKGLLDRKDSISLVHPLGEEVSVQTWPLAYWPDGSVKWTGHAAVMEEGTSESFEFRINSRKQEENMIVMKEATDSIEVNTGQLQCVINKTGKTLIRSLAINGSLIGSDGKLVAIKEEQQESDQVKIIQQERLEGEITHIEIEQSGPVRAVIKIKGIHSNSNNSFLPFVTRLYFYASLAEIKITQSFVYDGDAQADFIKGLGIEFSAGLSGEAWNRNVRFAGDEGMYSEPGQLLLTRRYQNANGLYEKQIASERVDIGDDETLYEHVKGNAEWNDFKIIQDSADHYKIMKRTGQGCSWVESTHGTRAQGLMYAGGANGGMAIGMKNFWQKHPSSLEVSQLTDDDSKMTIWFWSPDCEAMDFRHYSKKTHVLSAYEGFDEMRATPMGIANTSEIFITCFSASPTHQELDSIAKDWQDSLLLVCEPEYYHKTQASGIWSLPDYENPFKAYLENQLDAAFSFYKDEVEQRSWYGYWNYGDVMHTYDPVRHQWRYDLGGFAWQNTELVPNIWLWYAFLRTGREDIFKMAEAMTRHTSEVDQYHLGDYAGLGSRHNVMHWGCGCKEARVSMAGLHKYYYFLTADERTRDLLSDVRDADYATVDLDPMREYFPKDEFPTHTRIGPDWASFCSNWLSEWERTENKVYKNKIITGIDDLKQLPYRLLSGPVFGYDPNTSHLHHMGDGITGGYHMAIAFGAPQVWMEIAQLLDDEEWKEMIAEFGEFYSLSDQEKRNRSEGVLHDGMFNWPMFSAGMVAYAAAKKQDKVLARKAWNLLLDPEYSHTPLPIEKNDISSWRKLEEIPWITTNTVSQWCLNTIVALELVGNMLPNTAWQESVIVEKSVKKL